MSVAKSIHEKLNAAFPGASIDVRDESLAHAGHAGAPDGGQSHFRIRVVSGKFKGLTRVARQRLINDALREELAGPIHALAMQTLTPDEEDAE